MERMSTLTIETRNDLHLTSTGVAHSIRQQPPENSIKVQLKYKQVLFLIMTTNN